MRSRARSMVIAASLVAALTAATGGVGGAGVPLAACGVIAHRPLTPSGPVARGATLVAADGAALVVIDPSTTAAFSEPGEGVIRHVTTAAGIGTAFVRDLAGPDVVVAQTPAGTVELPQPGEALHPSWSPSGELVWSLGSSLRVRSPDGRIATIAAPEGARMVFSPVFTGPETITVVVSESVPGAGSEDEALSDLWTFDRTSAAWTRRTSFAATADRWSVIRTPVVTPSGDLEFVRLFGSASATASPTAELWRLTAAGPTLIRRLPGEMFLAGSVGGRRVWNLWDAGVGDWRLLAERPGGGLHSLGCGRVTVDPLEEVDPDLGAPRAAAAGGAGPAEPRAHVLTGILVGDFATRQAAREARGRIALAYGGEVRMLVVNHGRAPTAVAPGAWAVVTPVPAGIEMEAALERFRAAVPDLAASSWMVYL